MLSVTDLYVPRLPHQFYRFHLVRFLTPTERPGNDLLHDEKVTGSLPARLSLTF